ncbi:MAG: DNA topoisomerase 3 [Solirubrobacterales bacterium]|nr:DNA topoisomerase 3 [Solirubrobacterales bacterium]
MGKTLVIAEKPSVGKELVKQLPGPFQATENKAALEGPDHVVTWAVGHLVQLADPDEYDAKYAKWRMADLPIVPDKFKLVVRDERSKKQMSVVSKELGRSDVDQVVNACDAGREGELIFAYLYEKAGSKLPVQRLWLNSMAPAAIKEAFAGLRPSEEFASLEEAARSRSEADWIVGMNATRAATIRLRSSFDGAVSLGRVQTPTLAILARREVEIREFKPEPYWLVDARFLAQPDEPRRAYEGRLHVGANPRLKTAEEAAAVVAACDGQIGEITKLDKSTRKDRPPLLYDLTSLQREASSRYGFTASRTLRAAQSLYEDRKALTYPRTNSRYITSDMISDIKPIAGLVGARKEYATAAAYVQGLDKLPLQRVVWNEKVTDHHAIIPTLAEKHPVDKMKEDELKIYDLVVRRFLAVFHPEAVFENTRLETTVAGHIFRTRGKVLLVPGWRGVYGEGTGADAGTSGQDEDEGAEQQLPQLEKGEQSKVHRIKSEAKETKPPRRYSDGSLLTVMETAGKLVDDDEAREAMKESGIGTPATRSAIIERLLQVGYIERDGRSLVVTEKGLNVIRLLGDHALTSPSLTGEWEQRLARIETGGHTRQEFMSDIAKFAEETIHTLDTTLKDVRIPRANLGPCPVCGQDIIENRKGYSCWSRNDPGCGFVIWKAKAGKTLTAQIVRELIKTGRTEKPVTGFKGRSGKSFRARLALMQTEERRWRVEFDEPWAKAGAKPPDPDETAAGAASPDATAEAPADAVAQPPAEAA